MNNRPYNDWDFVEDKPGPWFDCAALVNDSPNNTGLRNLPPAISRPTSTTPTRPELLPGAVRRRRDGRPALRLRRRQPAPRRSSRSGSTAAASSMSGRRTGSRRPASPRPSRRPRTCSSSRRAGRSASRWTWSFGPDGSLYVLEYGNSWGTQNDDSGIYRIDYVAGNRTPAGEDAVDENSGAAAAGGRASTRRARATPTATHSPTPGTSTATARRTRPASRVAHRSRPPGNYTPRVTVTDVNGASSVANLTVSVGNTRPGRSSRRRSTGRSPSSTSRSRSRSR